MTKEVPIMSNGALEALRADREALLEICKGLDHSDFQKESGCAGWSLQDLVAHMGALFRMVVDPSTVADLTGIPVEQAQNVLVERRRSWGPDQVVGDYESVSAEALEGLSAFVGQEFEIPLGDLGTYSADLLVNAYTFDHYTHIRADMFGPRGPLVGAVPSSDEFHLAPTIDWTEAAIAQQNSGIVAAIPGTVEMNLHGPAARSIVVGTGERVASISCDTKDFVLMITNRASWTEAGVVASGDEEALDLARKLHVF
jgi:Mycothiol maleylpyruvate isomerase N-terminal domain